MFAGAAREAVFSNPEVIRRVNAEFVPVALKAALVNNPPDGAEGRLYEEIGRSKPAPQGICVVNSAGKVLDWVLMFNDDQSVTAFLDHALRRFRDHPDAKRPVAAERYMKFPGMKLPDVADRGEVLPVADRHSRASCPAQARFRQGTIIAHLFGRALGPDGRPVADTVRQEHYVEDRFDLSIEAQELLAKKLLDPGRTRFRLPDELARLFVSHAFLGQIDVNPLGSPAGGRGDLEQCEFWVRRVSAEGNRPLRLRIEGKTAVVGSQDASRPDGRSDGRIWEHAVRLTWDGFIEMSGSRMMRLLLAARGSEKLKWGNASMKGENDVARLPGGHPIDLACEVRYGIIGEPVRPDEVGAADPPTQPLPAEAGGHLMAALGPPFAIFLPVVQEDLKVSDEQQQRLQELKIAAAHGFHQFMQQTSGLPQDEREKKHREFRQEAIRALGAALAQLLKPDQQKRLRQIALQQEGLFALGNPDVAGELKLSDAQKMKLATIVQDTQKRFEALQQKAQSSGRPEEIQREGVKLRKGQEAKVEALLTGPQKQQWKAMLGAPLKLGPDASA